MYFSFLIPLLFAGDSRGIQRLWSNVGPSYRWIPLPDRVNQHTQQIFTKTSQSLQKFINFSGFSLPFYVTGSLQFILFLLAWAFFPNVPTTEKRKDDQSYPFMPLFKIPKFVLTMLMLFSGALSINFVEPSIQLHLLPVCFNKNSFTKIF